MQGFFMNIQFDDVQNKNTNYFPRIIHLRQLLVF